MGFHSARAEGDEDWLEVEGGIQNISKSNRSEVEGRKLIYRFSQKSTCGHCNADEADKNLSKLSFKDKGVRVGFGNIKHWLKRHNLALHQQLVTSEEILEKTNIRWKPS